MTRDPFGGSVPYSNRTTSRDTAKAIEAQARSIRDRIHNALLMHGPQTRGDMESRLRITHQSATGRMKDLIDEGLVRETGEERMYWPTRRKQNVCEGLAEGLEDVVTANDAY